MIELPLIFIKQNIKQMVYKHWKKKAVVTSWHPSLLFEVPCIFMTSMSLKGIHAKSSSLCFGKNYQLVDEGSVWDTLDRSLSRYVLTRNREFNDTTCGFTLFLEAYFISRWEWFNCGPFPLLLHLPWCSRCSEYMMNVQ